MVEITCLSSFDYCLEQWPCTGLSTGDKKKSLISDLILHSLVLLSRTPNQVLPNTLICSCTCLTPGSMCTAKISPCMHYKVAL